MARSGGVVRFEVYDSDSVSKDDLLGYVEVPLEALLNGEKVDIWLKLKLAQEFKKLLKLDKLKRVTSHSSQVYLFSNMFTSFSFFRTLLVLVT